MFLLYFFYYVVIYFALPFELMLFKFYKLLLFKFCFSNIWLFSHFYSIFYIFFYVAGSWILMNKLRLCINLINLFFKFLLFKNQKKGVDMFLVAFFSITLPKGKSPFLSPRIKVGIISRWEARRWQPRLCR